MRTQQLKVWTAEWLRGQQSGCGSHGAAKCGEGRRASWPSRQEAFTSPLREDNGRGPESGFALTKVLRDQHRTRVLMFVKRNASVKQSLLLPEAGTSMWSQGPASTVHQGLGQPSYQDLKDRPHRLSCCHRTRCSIKEQDLDEAQVVETRITASGSQEVQATYLGSSICPSAPLVTVMKPNPGLAWWLSGKESDRKSVV